MNIVVFNTKNHWIAFMVPLRQLHRDVVLFIFMLLTIRGKMIIAGVAEIPTDTTHTHTHKQQ